MAIEKEKKRITGAEKKQNMKFLFEEYFSWVSPNCDAQKGA